MQAQQTNIQLQLDNIQTVIKAPGFLKMITEQKRLTQQLMSMQQKIDNLKPTFLSAEDMPTLTKKMLNQQRNNIALISLKELPGEPWPGLTTDNKNVKNDINSLNTLSGVYQHMVQIEFQNDYYNTIVYLKQLENISWNMYWDSLDYKVLKYPKVEVLIKSVLAFRRVESLNKRYWPF